MGQALQPGALLDSGRYRIDKVLGSGGFGITYLATNMGLGVQRAIKEFFVKDFCERNEATSQVSLGTANTAQLVEKLKDKFIKEARNIARLEAHPGIVNIYTVFEENNTAYYVMEYVEGETFSEMVKSRGPLPPGRALKYIREVGNALEYVHHHRLNHLDVKPANIIVRRRDDKPILIDFGLSKQYDSEGHQTSTTPVGISHGYAPIEQYNAGGVKMFSPETDVYSLAATLYYLLTGNVPPQATEMVDEELSFPVGIPANMQKSIRKAMSTSRKHRPESVSKFLDTLENGGGESEDDHTIIIEEGWDEGVGVPGATIPINGNDGNGNDGNGSDNGKRGFDVNTPLGSPPDPDGNKKESRSWIFYLIFIVLVVIILIIAIASSNNGVDYEYDPWDTAVAVDSVVAVDELDTMEDAVDSTYVEAYEEPTAVEENPHRTYNKVDYYDPYSQEEEELDPYYDDEYMDSAAY